MQVSLEWLNEYVDISDLTPELIAHELTMSGLEVEEIEKTGSSFTNIVVAEIMSIKPHPNADKLQLVEIFNGTEKREVVCGARNIEVGQIIPYASVESEVLDRKTGEKFALKPATIRGVESQGMLCSAEELGLDTKDYQKDDGILILNRFIKNIKPGQDIKEALNIKEDTILHVAPTANRGDQMSIHGVAREVASIFNKKFHYSEIKDTKNRANTNFNIEIIDEDTCKYYSVGILKDVKIGPSPEWMTRRLEASGMRSISNIVDITNYVMLEYGQPLHAFDIDKVGENYLCVRRAKEGEKLVTLDDVERKLTHDSVVIANSKESIGLAGVMGGLSTEIDDNTKHIALESAYFTPPTNRRSSRSIGIRTEACARFERGVDIGSVKPALMRAMQLMAELADARVEGFIETGSNKLPDIEIILRFSQVKRILGIDIPDYRCIEILENLGFELLGRNDFSTKFLVPSYRINDVTREIDLIEEIARINGYDKIEPTLPRKTQAPEISQETVIINKVNQIFVGKGFKEIITSSLIGKPLLNWIGFVYDEEKAVRVANPQSDEHTMLRQNLVPSVLQVIKHNFDQGQKNLWLFETGKTYKIVGEPNAKTSSVEETRVIAGAVTGSIQQGIWHETEKVDFYTVKGIAETLFKELGIESRVEYRPVSDVAWLHPGRAAEVVLLGKGMPRIGLIGQLHPETEEKCKLNQNVYVFEINLEDILANLSTQVTKYRQLPQYPSVQRDLAFIVSKSTSHQDIEKLIKKSSSNLFKSSQIFDVYEGKNIPEGHKSVAYRITFQDPEATLTDERVDAEMSKIREGLKKLPAISFRE